VVEARVDGPSGRRVLMVAGRAARPHTTHLAPPPDDPAECPFCPGREHRTPPEVARVGPGPADGPGWQVRVVPNLYPIVRDAGPPPDGPAGAGTEGAGAPAATGTRWVAGVHEVVILSPDHHRTFAHLTDDEAATVLAVMRDRTRVHLDAGAAWATAVLNQGRAAGASIAHPHAQVFALDVVPCRPARRTAAGAPTVDPLTDDLETARDVGLVLSEDPVPVWLPHAGWVPYLLRLAAPGAGPVFADATDAVVAPVAVALRDGLSRLGAALGALPYNVVVHTAPRPGPATSGPATPGPARWWVEVVPRLGVPAGFEMATGWWVNVTPPELAVGHLRRGGGEG